MPAPPHTPAVARTNAPQRAAAPRRHASEAPPHGANPGYHPLQAQQRRHPTSTDLALTPGWHTPASQPTQSPPTSPKAPRLTSRSRRASSPEEPAHSEPTHLTKWTDLALTPGRLAAGSDPTRSPPHGAPNSSVDPASCLVGSTVPQRQPTPSPTRGAAPARLTSYPLQSRTPTGVDAGRPRCRPQRVVETRQTSRARPHWPIPPGRAAPPAEWSTPQRPEVPR